MARFRYSVKFLFLFFLCTIFVSCEKNEVLKPEDNRFSKVILIENLDEPMQMEILKDSRVLFVERKGKVKVFDPATNQTNILADIPVSIGYYSKTGEVLESTGEDGMQGVAIDPNFNENHWIYLYYSPEGGEPRSILTRYEWRGNALDMNSKKILLEVPNQRESCCHLGGGMLFDAGGNLLLTTGDNTPNDPRGYSPLDERSGNSRFDAQRTSGNTNDLRGKILRIHPEPDGSYSIPEGNLFPEGTPNTRPEIYTMGNRNPWRLSIDSKTGWLYWGEVGPYGTTDSTGLGPRSYDEFNQAREPGNFGWPYFIADNKAYWEYDYASDESGKQYESSQPMNDSPNNSGAVELPPSQPAFIWYPQSPAVDFPLLGSGSNSAVGGPIYHRSDFDDPERPFPEYYEGKWLITDWTRGWIMAVTMDENGNFASMEQFLPKMELRGPIDMDFGPEGDLYLLEYGRGPYQRNPEAQLVKIVYNEGNRQPIAEITADKTVGAVPLKVRLSSEGTIDYDEDSLRFEWQINNQGKTIETYAEKNPMVTFNAPGIYKAEFTVTDPEGAKNSKTLNIIAGNEPPQVSFDFNGANQSFFFPAGTIDYRVLVNDQEDGSMAENDILPSQVKVSIDYLPGGYDVRAMKQQLKHVEASVSLQSVLADQLINNSDCKSCHMEDKKSIGPAYVEVAEKYWGKEDAKEYLTNKIIKGGSGVWGEMAMPAHPTMSENNVHSIVDYILSLEVQQSVKAQPVQGSYVTNVPEGYNKHGSFFFRASYTDHGAQDALQQSAVETVILRYPEIPVAYADKIEGMEFNHKIDPSKSTISPKERGAYIGLDKIDLTGITKIELRGSDFSNISNTGALFEVRIDDPNGKIISKISDSRFVINDYDQNKTEIILDIDTVKGFHDIYVLYKKEGEVNPLMQLRSISFIQ
jgi:cytochrome c